MRFRRRLGTRWRLTIWVLAIVFVVTVVAGVIAVKVVERRFVDDIDRNLRDRTMAMVGLLTVIPPDQLVELATQTDLGRVTNNNEAVFIIDAGGADLALPSGDRDRPDALPDLETIGVSELRRRSGEVFQLDGIDGVPTYRVLTAQLPDGRVLAVAAPLTGLDNAIDTLGSVMFIVAVATSLVLVVVIALVIGYVTRPIAGMIATAESIGSGELDSRIPTSGVDDVARLATALNTMLDRLGQAFADKEASEDALRRFVADASHELRTPLSAVLGYAELVQSGMASSPQQIDHAVGRITAEGERMRLLVEELLLLARLDRGRAAQRVMIDLQDLVVTAVGDARAIAPERPVTMQSEVDGGGQLLVLADADSLRQAIDNLLANARTHTPAGSQIEVTVRRRGALIDVVVDDDGPGVDPDDAAHLFDRFFRSERSRARPGGAGLGLAIVAAVAAAHEGSATVETAPLGGARFVLSLPAASVSDAIIGIERRR